MTAHFVTQGIMVDTSITILAFLGNKVFFEGERKCNIILLLITSSNLKSMVHCLLRRKMI